MVSYFFLGAGADPRFCRDRAAPAGCAADLFDAGAQFRFRRDFAAPAGVCASGPGARSRPRRDRAALAGCKAPGLCIQVAVDRDVFILLRAVFVAN